MVECLLAPRSGPHQADLRVDPVCMQAVHERDDRVHVVRARVGRIDSVDSEDAVLVEADVDDVDVPRRQGRDHRVVAGAVEDPEPVDARVLGAGVVDAVEMDDVPVAVQQLIPGDVEPGARGRRRRRRWWRRRAALRGGDDTGCPRGGGRRAVPVGRRHHDAQPRAGVTCGEPVRPAVRAADRAAALPASVAAPPREAVARGMPRPAAPGGRERACPPAPGPRRAGLSGCEEPSWSAPAPLLLRPRGGRAGRAEARRGRAGVGGWPQPRSRRPGVFLTARPDSGS